MSMLKPARLLGKVKRTIEKHSLLSPGDRVVLAVSGGPDSVCLLSVLQALSPQFDLSLHVAHLDHMFRGKQSADEALFVAALAKKLGLPSTVEAVDVPSYCRDRGLSSQSGAREVRYAFLERVAREVQASRIATGHTASDQAETFLLRLLRGAGMSGLSSIPPVRGIIVRPLIEATREEIEEYLRLRGISFVSDPSNVEPVYARNRIRLQVLPLLKAFNPRIVETLASEAALLRDEDAASEACLEVRAQGILGESDDRVSLRRSQFNELPVAHKRRLLRKAVDLAGGASSDLSLVQIDEALDFIGSAQTGRGLELPTGLTILREYDLCLFRQPEQLVSFSVALAVPGRTSLPELGLELNAIVTESTQHEPREQPAEAADAENYLWQALFDYDKIGPEIRVRNRAAGDRFCPAGMAGKSKKLQDFFVDARVARSRRDRVALLAAGEAVLWVIGMRTDERFLPGPDTKRVLTVTVRRP